MSGLYSLSVPAKDVRVGDVLANVGIVVEVNAYSWKDTDEEDTDEDRVRLTLAGGRGRREWAADDVVVVLRPGRTVMTRCLGCGPERHHPDCSQMDGGR